MAPLFGWISYFSLGFLFFDWCVFGSLVRWFLVTSGDPSFLVDFPFLVDFLCPVFWFLSLKAKSHVPYWEEMDVRLQVNSARLCCYLQLLFIV